MRYKFVLLVFLLIGAIQINLASAIEGTIRDAGNEPLPFCNVFIKNTSYACASNEAGFYSLPLPAGKYTIVFQFIGYSKKEIVVEVGVEKLLLDVIMEEEIMELNEVVVSSNKEDPAYAVMRKAIALRESHLKAITGYSCEVYIKGMQKLIEAPDKILGIELNTVLDVDSNNTGIIYLSESVSTFNYQYPDKTKEIMKASIVSGDDKNFSWNDAASLQMDFYNNLQKIEGFSERGFVSPVADNAMFFYDYKLLSYVFENNHEIFKIGVTPKRKTDPAFTGVIYITDDDYRFTAIQLQLRKENGFDFIDTFRVEQEYFNADGEHLVLLSNKFDFDYSVFGIKGKGYFHGFYKDYAVNKIFSKKFFDAEVTKIESGSNEKDSLYWINTRPVQLTGEEVKDYIQKDSIRLVKESPEYIDSMDHIANKIKIGDLLTGYSYRDSQKKIGINSNPIYYLIQFNTVEGYVINPEVHFIKRWDNKDEFYFSPNARIGIGAGSFYLQAKSGYVYNQRSSSSIMIGGGTTVQQFNEYGILPLANSVASLFLENNYLKIYKKQYGTAAWSHELINGLYSTVSTEYAARSPLFNLRSADPWIDYDNKTFTPNNFPFALSEQQINSSIPTLFTTGLELKYKIGQKYISAPDNKYIFDNKYPVVTFKYEKAIAGVARSEVAYDKLELKVNDGIALGLAGNMHYASSAGIMISDQELNTADKFNFAGNETFINKLPEDSYFILPYYAALSDEYYFAAHIQWHTEGFLFRKLPLFKQLKVEPVFSFNYLQSNTVNNYFEVAAGIEHIFKFGRIDFAYSPHHFENMPSDNYRILIGIGF